MKKGLTKTLMAVAVVIMAVQAMAMAPVIQDIPSPVVGNAENVTPAQGFVYPDAIDLTKYVTDQESNSSQIIWSYEIVGTPKYKINNVPSMNYTLAGGDDPVAPGAKSLNNALTGGEANFDNNPLTITIRNIELSPVIGAPGNDVSTVPGVLLNQSQQVIFYASDQTTFTATDGLNGHKNPVWFYSTNLQNDYLSPGLTKVWGWTAADGATGFRWADPNGATSSVSGTNGVCITTTAGGDKTGTWKSPYGAQAQATIQLAKNSAYRIRLTLTSSQTDIDKVPFFDVYVGQFDPIGSNYYGQNYFGANFFVYSANSSGGANGAVSPSKSYDFWWTPPCVSTARWNNEATGTISSGPFNPANVDNRNAYVAFRVLQTAAVSTTANGTMCLQSLEIDKADMNSMQSLSTVWEATSMTPVTSQGLFQAPVANGTATFSGGKLTITPSGSNPTGLFAQVLPGDGNIDYLTQSVTVDDYPCPMDNQTLYLVSMGVSAPTQNDMDHPPQMFWVGADTMTNELIQLNYVSLMGYAYAMPAYTSADTPQPYKSFFYSNYGTLHGNNASFAWWSCFRPRFMIANGTLNPGETQVGAVRIHNVKVEKVMFP